MDLDQSLPSPANSIFQFVEQTHQCLRKKCQFLAPVLHSGSDGTHVARSSYGRDVDLHRERGMRENSIHGVVVVVQTDKMSQYKL